MKIKTLAMLAILVCPISTVIYADDVEYSQTLVQKAQKGDAEAQYDLGEAYYQGYNVDQDYQEAFKWYKKSLCTRQISQNPYPIRVLPS